MNQKHTFYQGHQSLHQSLIRLVGLLLLLSVGSLHAKQNSYQTYVIHTHGNPNLVQVVQNELSPAYGGSGGTVTLYQDQLIIRATPADHARILPLIRQLDVAPIPLTISVTLNNQQSAQQSGGHIYGGVINRGVWINGQYHNTQSQSISDAHYTARTQSGATVKIGTSTLLGLTTSRVHHNRYRAWVSFGTSWVSLDDGFSATPRVLPSGQISLDINTTNTHHQSGQTPNNSSMNTSVTLSRGQWAKIGEIRTESQSSNSYIQQSSTQILPIWVKVE